MGNYECFAGFKHPYGLDVAVVGMFKARHGTACGITCEFTSVYLMDPEMCNRMLEEPALCKLHLNGRWRVNDDVETSLGELYLFTS